MFLWKHCNVLQQIYSYLLTIVVKPQNSLFSSLLTLCFSPHSSICIVWHNYSNNQNSIFFFFCKFFKFHLFINKVYFDLNFNCKKAFFELQVYKQLKRIFFTWPASCCFCVFEYPCRLKAWYKLKFKSKVVFIILIKSPTTVVYE